MCVNAPPNPDPQVMLNDLLVRNEDVDTHTDDEIIENLSNDGDWDHDDIYFDDIDLLHSFEVQTEDSIDVNHDFE